MPIRRAASRAQSNSTLSCKDGAGAAMSVGRISSFLDVYIERDLKDGILDEAPVEPDPRVFFDE